jgi:hypothetical protein
MNVELAILCIDLIYLAYDKVYMIIQQATFRPDQLIALCTKIVKWQVKPAGHIRMLPGTIDQRDFSFLAV